MVDEAQYFSMKKFSGFLWKTKLTRREVLERLSIESDPQDWLVCPLGEVDKSVDGKSFLANPSTFVMQADESATSPRTDQPDTTGTESKLCIDCGAPLHEIRLIDKGDGQTHNALEYAAIDAKRSFFLRHYPTIGQIQAFLCQSCGAVRLYAKPHTGR